MIITVVIIQIDIAFTVQAYKYPTCIFRSWDKLRSLRPGAGSRSTPRGSYDESGCVPTRQSLPTRWRMVSFTWSPSSSASCCFRWRREICCRKNSFISVRYGCFAFLHVYTKLIFNAFKKWKTSVYKIRIKIFFDELKFIWTLAINENKWICR